MRPKQLAGNAGSAGLLLQGLSHARRWRHPAGDDAPCATHMRVAAREAAAALTTVEPGGALPSHRPLAGRSSDWSRRLEGSHTYKLVIAWMVRDVAFASKWQEEGAFVRLDPSWTVRLWGVARQSCVCCGRDAESATYYFPGGHGILSGIGGVLTGPQAPPVQHLWQRQEPSDQMDLSLDQQLLKINPTTSHGLTKRC